MHKLLEILTLKEGRLLTLIFILNIIVGVSTVSFISLFEKFFQIVLAGNASSLSIDNFMYHELRRQLNLSSENTIILMTGIFSVIMSISLMIRVLLHGKFIYSTYETLTRRMINHLAYVPISKLLSLNKEECQSAFVNDINIVTEQFFRPAIEAFSSMIIILIFVCAFLFNGEYADYVLISIVSAYYFLSYKVTKTVLSNHSKTRVQENNFRSENALLAIQNIISLRVNDRLQTIKRNIMYSSKKIKDLMVSSVVLAEIPKYFLELCILAFITFGYMYFANQIHEGQAILGEFLVYAISAQRILPEVARIQKAAATIKFSIASAKNIVEYNCEKGSHQVDVHFTSYADYKSFFIPEQKIKFNESAHILNMIDIEIYFDQNTAITGKSGTGKTTIINIILGLMQDEEIHCYVDKQKVDEQFVNKLQQNIAYHAQGCLILPGTVGYNFESLSSQPVDMQYASELLLEFDLINDLEGSREFLDRNAQNLSAGQQQRVSLISTLLHQKKFIILDEATANLNEELDNKIISYLCSQENFKVLCVTHRLTSLPHFDKIIGL